MRESGRIISIDILKVFAVLIVLNSHMEICYHPYEILATGGAIGDALFFFSSGFTLFLGKTMSFDNWYKRRISRIYPTIFVIAVIMTLFFNGNANIVDIIIRGGGWFVSCIMIYYVVIYFIQKYMIDKFNYVYTAVACLILVWYAFFFDNENAVSLYGNTYFKWCFFFVFMLQGAVMGKNHLTYSYHRFVIPKLLGCMVVWYSFFLLQHQFPIIVTLQVLSLIPLLGITYYIYLLCNASFWKKLYEKKYLGQALFLMGSLCLEVYLVQSVLFTDKLNFMFPLNIPVIMISVFMVAYTVNFFSNLWSQTFKTEQYDWKSMFLRKK